jgi:hypothetical protein
MQLCQDYKSKVEKFASDLVQTITSMLVLSSFFVFLHLIPQIGSLEGSLLCAQSLDSLWLRIFGDHCENHAISRKMISCSGR